MARPLRIQYPGAVYHITHRGNERQSIFKTDDDRRQFLKILHDGQKIYSVILHSFVLMDSHYHLLVETPRGNLSELMRYINITYTSYFNRTYDRSGHLYRGRYKSFLIEKEAYLSSVSRYIHLNPAKIKKIRSKSAKKQLKYLFSYKWSSLAGFANLSKRVENISYDSVLEEFGGDTKTGRAGYKKQIALDLIKNEDISTLIVGQSILGGEKFIITIREKYLPKKKDRERPAIGKILTYLTDEKILAAIEEITGLSKEEILTKPGAIRQLAMDMLYRYGGLTNPQIGRLMGIDYSTVSQGRKRLRTRIKRDAEIAELAKIVDKACQD